MVKPSEYYFGGFLFPWFWAQDLHQNFTGLVQYTFRPVFSGYRVLDCKINLGKMYMVLYKIVYLCIVSL